MIGNYIGAPIGGVINTDTGNTGFLAVTLDDAALSSTGAVAIAGQVPVVLDAAVLSATGALAISGTSSITLDDVSLAATGALGISGTEGTLLDDVTLVATAHVAARVLARIGDGGYANTPATISGKRTIVMAGANIGRTSARGSSLTHLTAGGGRL